MSGAVTVTVWLAAILPSVAATIAGVPLSRSRKYALVVLAPDAIGVVSVAVQGPPGAVEKPAVGEDDDS